MCISYLRNEGNLPHTVSTYFQYSYRTRGAGREVKVVYWNQTGILTLNNLINQTLQIYSNRTKFGTVPTVLA